MTRYNFRAEFSKLLALGPNSSPYQFLYSTWAKDGFYILKWLEKIKKEAIFHDVWKLCKIQTSVFINHDLQKHNHAIHLLVVRGNHGGVEWLWQILTMWLTKTKSLKYLLTGLLQRILQLQLSGTWGGLKKPPQMSFLGQYFHRNRDPMILPSGNSFLGTHRESSWRTGMQVNPETRYIHMML